MKKRKPTHNRFADWNSKNVIVTKKSTAEWVKYGKAKSVKARAE